MQGLVVENVSNLYKVKSIDKIYNCSVRGKIKNSSLIPVVGDFVDIEIINEEKKEAVINDVLSRRTFIKRPKLANITQIVVVTSMKDPKLDILLLDKQLAFAEYIGIKAIIVLNKIDLDTQKIYEEIEDEYKRIGYKTFKTDAKTGIGIDDLKVALQNNKNAFAGNSGVGKSSLINKIFSKDITEEGEVSYKNKKGKNTTTITRLYELTPDTFIADTPGFSTFDINEIHSEDLDEYFREFRIYKSDCKYDDCTHIKEISCNIKYAVERGLISKTRYDNYVKIYKEIEDKEKHKW